MTITGLVSPLPVKKVDRVTIARWSTDPLQRMEK